MSLLTIKRQLVLHSAPVPQDVKLFALKVLLLIGQTK